MSTHAVGIYVFDEVEVLDFAGPFEVFSTASRVERRHLSDQAPAFSVTLIATRPAPYRAGRVPGGPSSSFADTRRRLLIVPGRGFARARAQRRRDWIRAHRSSTPLIARSHRRVSAAARRLLVGGA